MVFGGAIEQFVTMGLVGMVINAIFSISFQFGAEITYPAPESTMTGLLSITGHLISFVLTQILQFELDYFELCPRIGSMFGIGTLVASLLCGFFVAVVITEDRKREKAGEIENSDKLWVFNLYSFATSAIYY